MSETWKTHAIGKIKVINPPISLVMKCHERFFSKVKKTKGCWNWVAGCEKNGYGKFHIGGRPQKAHRISWAIANKRTSKKCILHTCDNKKCVNPKHLYEGTYKHNALDRENRNRGNHPIGARNAKTKLSASDVQIIREFYGKCSQRGLASVFGVSHQAIRDVASRKNWAHIP